MRLYGFVMYNLSGIQKGIQFGHAALEYVLEHGNKDPKLCDFMKNHKTFILLSGGGSIDMLDRKQELEALEIRHSCFYEPDLNGSLSAIVFLVDEEDYADEDLYEVNPIKQYIRKFRLA